MVLCLSDSNSYSVAKLQISGPAVIHRSKADGFEVIPTAPRQPLQLHCYAHVPDQGQYLKIASKNNFVQNIPYQIVHIHLGYFVVNSLYHN